MAGSERNLSSQLNGHGSDEKNDRNTAMGDWATGNAAVFSFDGVVDGADKSCLIRFSALDMAVDR